MITPISIGRDKEGTRYNSNEDQKPDSPKDPFALVVEDIENTEDKKSKPQWFAKKPPRVPGVARQMDSFLESKHIDEIHSTRNQNNSIYIQEGSHEDETGHNITDQSIGRSWYNRGKKVRAEGQPS